MFPPTECLGAHSIIHFPSCSIPYHHRHHWSAHAQTVNLYSEESHLPLLGPVSYFELYPFLQHLEERGTYLIQA